MTLVMLLGIRIRTTRLRFLCGVRRNYFQEVKAYAGLVGGNAQAPRMRYLSCNSRTSAVALCATPHQAAKCQRPPEERRAHRSRRCERAEHVQPPSVQLVLPGWMCASAPSGSVQTDGDWSKRAPSWYSGVLVAKQCQAMPCQLAQK